MSDSKPPSRRKYEEQNPTVSFRISKTAKGKLNEHVADLKITKKEWFENLIEDERGRFRAVFRQGFTKGRKRGREEGYDEGYEDGRRAGYKKGVAKVPCAECGEAVAVDSDDRKQKLYEAIERVNTEWTALPPPDTLECDIRHSDCRSDR